MVTDNFTVRTKSDLPPFMTTLHAFAKFGIEYL